jgi:hypothetical protein
MLHRLPGLGAEDMGKARFRQAGRGGNVGQRHLVGKMPLEIAQGAQHAWIVAGAGGGWVQPIAIEKQRLERVHGESLTAAQIAVKQPMHGVEPRSQRRIGDLQQHQAGRHLRPVEPGQPVGTRLEMRPEQFPSRIRRGDGVIVQGPRAEQHPVTGPRQQFAASMAEAAGAADSVDQQPVVAAARPKGAIARCLMEVPGQQLQDRPVRELFALSHSRIVHAIGRMCDGRSGGSGVAS